MTTRQTPDAVREAILKYTQHYVSCAVYGSWADGEPKCTCGLDDARASLAALDSRAGDAGEVEEQAEDWLDARAAPGHSRDRDYGADDMIDAYIAGRSATPAPAVDAVPAGEVEQ